MRLPRSLSACSRRSIERISSRAPEEPGIKSGHFGTGYKSQVVIEDTHDVHSRYRLPGRLETRQWC